MRSAPGSTFFPSSLEWAPLLSVFLSFCVGNIYYIWAGSGKFSLGSATNRKTLSLHHYVPLYVLVMTSTLTCIHIVLDHKFGYLSLLPNLLTSYGWNPGRRIYKWFGQRVYEKTGDMDTTFKQVFCSSHRLYSLFNCF